jgi:predicted Zn-dependent protease
MKMKKTKTTTTRFKKSLTLLLIAALGAPVFAQNTKDARKDAKVDIKKSAIKALEEKNDPTLVGKRDINKGQLAFYSIEREVALGRQMAQEVERQSPVVTDPVINEFVNRVTQNIVLHSDAKVPFTVKVIDSNDVNAFALPGGFLYVNRGLLEAAENEAEVAGVLAHEIAHVTARHGIEQASKAEFFNYASIPLIFLGGIGGYLIRQGVGLAVPLTFLKFSRGAEKEADRLGAQYMWAAGYDPNALVTFFEKLNGREKKKPGTLAKVFSTHPLTGDRITEVNELITRFPERSEYSINTSEFGQLRSRLVAASNASRQAQREADDRRPTLKRRPQSTNGDDENGAYSETPDRPVLKRRDEPAAGSAPTTGGTSSEGDRPVLKRRDGGPADPAKPAKPESESGETERPTLKRRTDPPTNE